jgi:HSP20 family protein
MADSNRRESERGTIQPRRGSGPGIDVTRTEDGYDVEIPVPGFRPEDIDVTYQDGMITVSGRSERRTFTRSLSVPEDVDDEQIEASVEHGVLMLHLKQLPQRQPRRINIRGAAQRTTPSSTTQTSR